MESFIYIVKAVKNWLCRRGAIEYLPVQVSSTGCRVDGSSLEPPVQKIGEAIFNLTSGGQSWRDTHHVLNC